MRPASSTRIWSAAAMVERRWAITIEVRPARAVASASWMWASLSESRCAVASSSTTMAGRLRSTRAMARRCFSPPDIRYPRSPTSVSYPSAEGPMKAQWAMIGAVALLLTACVAVPGPVPGIVIDPADPYYYSPTYCVGCWYGQWGGRIGYHRGGGRPWERPHSEADHHGENRGRDIMHEGHR